MKHSCHATGCSVEVEPRLFMCRKHWFMLPAEMRKLIWSNYAPQQEIYKDPSPQYIDIAQKCVYYIEVKELEIAQRVGEEANFAHLIDEADKNEKGKE